MTSEDTRPLSFSTTRSLVCDPGAIRRLGEICAALSPGKVFLVTDPGIVAAGLHEAALESLSSAGLASSVFRDVQADPPEDIVLNALELARDEKIGTVVGLGGGSSMDVAKLIAALCYSSQALSDAYGIGNLTGERLPLVQIPTTAGTGSEVTPISIITTGATTKAAVIAPQLLPDVALLDPELTLGLPPHVTAATGIDAMVHAIESFTSAIHKNPYSDMLALKALQMLSANIETAVHDGQDLDARTAMLLGSLLAGQAFANAPVAAVPRARLSAGRPLPHSARPQQPRWYCRTYCGSTTKRRRICTRRLPGSSGKGQARGALQTPTTRSRSPCPTTSKRWWTG